LRGIRKEHFGKARQKWENGHMKSRHNAVGKVRIREANPCRITAVEISRERGVDDKRLRRALRDSGEFPSHKMGNFWTVSYGSKDHHKMIDVLKKLICR